jgi:hypothetical protein
MRARGRIEPSRAGACAWLASVLVAMPAVGRAAEPAPPVIVRSTDCADLRNDELQRLLNLELARDPAGGGADSLLLRVRCLGDRIELRVVDPSTGQELQREIPAPPPGEPGRERIIALSVSELFSSAWLDLLVAPAPERVRPPPPEPEPAPESSPPPPTAPRPRRDGVLLSAGVHVRHAQAPVTTGALGLGYGGWVHRNWGVFGRVTAEYGGRTTPLGSVHALALAIGPRASFRTGARKRVRFHASLGASLLYLRLRGHTDRSDVRVGTAQALAADLRGSVGPIVDLRRGWLEIGLDGGFVVPGPRGRVSDRDPVRADGGWLGLALTWAITPSRRGAP